MGCEEEMVACNFMKSFGLNMFLFIFVFIFVFILLEERTMDGSSCAIVVINMETDEFILREGQ